MAGLCLRILLAIAISVALTYSGITGNAVVVQTLFTVLGIVFSISMSLMVSFNLSEVLDKTTHATLRASINHTRNCLLLDFAASTAALLAALVWHPRHVILSIISGINIDVMLAAAAVLTASLFYESYNFRRLHKLHNDIEDTICAEKASNLPH